MTRHYSGPIGWALGRAGPSAYLGWTSVAVWLAVARRKVNRAWSSTVRARANTTERSTARATDLDQWQIRQDAGEELWGVALPVLP